MRTTAAIATVLLAVMCAPGRGSLATAETNMLPPPGFHHLHLNSVDPAAANVLQGGAINARKLEEVPLSV
jgi:hypothetical protein